MSPRDRHLGQQERQRALAISRGLFAAADQFQAGLARAPARLSSAASDRKTTFGCRGSASVPRPARLGRLQAS
ncbi:hypothetical protein [Bradyrhizobium sp. USDA 336]|uniref:hypothetical protein n=1 Tax=Bradyrhizobium sp. USDA 336 TaxID=3156311 RepID=UPI0038513E6A